MMNTKLGIIGIIGIIICDVFLFFGLNGLRGMGCRGVGIGGLGEGKRGGWRGLGLRVNENWNENRTKFYRL